MRNWGVVIAIFLAALAPACLWDRDTMSAELSGLPKVVDAVAGRFDRNPDLYYQMRLDRVQKELATNPEKYDLYDDAAVALSRLGRNQEAIDLMDKKEKALKSAHLPKAELDDQMYRFYANRGTFKIHLWFAGSDHDDKTLLTSALTDLNSAVKINPDAHFGRENVQIGIVNMLIDPKNSGPITSLIKSDPPNFEKASWA